MSDTEVCDDYIETFTGGRFYFGERMWDSDVRIEDIAHALSIEPRFGGHARAPYSVAEHCCHVYDLMCSYGTTSVPGPLGALLHDAHEAYTKDVMKPLRRTPGMEGYEQIAKRAQSVIECRYGLERLKDIHRRDIKQFDMAMLKREAAEFMHSKGADWQWPDCMVGRSMAPQLWTWEEAKEEFLKRFIECW